MNSCQNAFISYGHADSRAFAAKLYQHLSDRGLKVWFDFEDIPLGVDFQNQIDDGIEKADNFLFVIAPHSINLPYCGKEIELALKRHKSYVHQHTYFLAKALEWESHQQRDSLKKHTGSVNDIAFSPDGELIASASADKTINLWQRDGTLVHTLKGHKASVEAVAFSPDGKLLASASDDGTIRLWNRDGTLLKALTEHKDEVEAVAFSPDGNLLASASDDSLQGELTLVNKFLS